MKFAFTEDQQLIAETAADFLADASTSEAVRAAMASARGHDPQLWQSLVTEMGWHGVHVPEDCGGLGLGFVELAILLEQMGRHLTCSPYFSTVALSASALRVAASPEQQQRWLGELADNGTTMTLAWTGALDADGGMPNENVTWAADGDGAILNGTCRHVPDGDTADSLLVAGRRGGQVLLCHIPAAAEGLSRTWTPTLDQTRRQAELIFDNVRVSAENILTTDGETALGQALDLARIAIAADQLGGIAQVLDAAVAYVAERQQFGRPVGSFQALKHKAADMALRAETARSAVYYAACIADEFLSGNAGPDQLAEAAATAKAWCSDAYYFNAGTAIQMHGGVGITWEYDVHLYFKRAKSSELLLGNAAFQRERVAAMLLDEVAE